MAFPDRRTLHVLMTALRCRRPGLEEEESSGRVIERDLAKTPLTFVDLDWIAGAYSPPEHHNDNQKKALAVAPSPISFPLVMELTKKARKSRLRLYWLARKVGNLLANGFLSSSPATGKTENDRINTGDCWWAWVDLNHRPRPYQYCGRW